MATPKIIIDAPDTAFWDLLRRDQPKIGHQKMSALGANGSPDASDLLRAIVDGDVYAANSGNVVQLLLIAGPTGVGKSTLR